MSAALDVRTAAQTEALERWPRQDISVMHDADLSNYLCRHGFEEGAVWGAVLVTPTREQIAQAIAWSADPEYGIVDDVDLAAADSVLALLSRSRMVTTQ